MTASATRQARGAAPIDAKEDEEEQGPRKEDESDDEDMKQDTDGYSKTQTANYDRADEQSNFSEASSQQATCEANEENAGEQ